MERCRACRSYHPRRVPCDIRRRIELEERKKAAERLLSDLREGKRKVPSGFVNEAIREGN